MPLSFKDVAEILKIIDASDCEEVSLDIEGIRLVVRRGGNAQSIPAGTATKPSPAAETPSNDPKSVEKTKVQVDEGHNTVRAPMVGTAYRRPAPDEEAFVEVGSRVEKGAPLCLIEVMKLFTTIEAPISGTIAAIHMEDAMLVEFDQVLFAIKPD
ncbi:MAG: acetyl-CoA carboxylase biotin carboxyl carrier protein [Rhodospirillales bacterium]|nr:acetyl-CoA carboxylase biotin carboxyl carrier protein [Rhodospirillales bacterium]